MVHASLPAGVRLLVIILLCLPAACGTREGEGSGDPLEVRGGWVRAMPALDPLDAPGGMSSAAYFTVRNGSRSPDILLSASSPAALRVEIHESREEGGVMRMRPVEEVTVPAEGEAVLRPGGLHLMLVGLTRSLLEGDTVVLELRFRDAGALTVRVPVLSSAPE